MTLSKLSDEQMHAEVLYTGNFQRLDAWAGERISGRGWRKKIPLLFEALARRNIVRTIKWEDRHPHKQVPEQRAIRQRWEEAFSKVLGEEDKNRSTASEKIFLRYDTKTEKPYYLRFRRYSDVPNNQHIDGVLIAEELRGNALPSEGARNELGIGYSDADIISQVVINRNTGMVERFILNYPHLGVLANPDLYQLSPEQVTYPNAAKQTAILLLHAGERIV
jgi:hypothetical protein